MVVEMCMWESKPGGMPRVLEAFEEAPGARTALSPLAGASTSDSGELNQLIHVWAYGSPEQRTRTHAEVARTGTWPPAVEGLIVASRSETLVAMPFSPPLQPQALGSIYEFRTYTLPTSAIPDLIERWSPVIEARARMSPLVGAWYTPEGPVSRMVHVWAYHDANDWQAIRAEAKSGGNWPPAPSALPGAMISQRSVLALPVSFSPLR